jgi:hypothetical protein
MQWFNQIMEMPIEGWGKIKQYEQEMCCGITFREIRHKHKNFQTPLIQFRKEDISNGESENLAVPSTVRRFSLLSDIFFARGLLRNPIDNVPILVLINQLLWGRNTCMITWTNRAVIAF